MTTTTARVVFILPRPARVALAALTDRLASKHNGMSRYATAAVQSLLADSDRVELTYMQATAVMSQGYAESARVEMARSRGRVTAQQAALVGVVELVRAQFETSGWRKIHDTDPNPPRD